jgi:hypothetical protein
MSKLKNIIKQLSAKDYTAIYESLLNSNAEKSAYLLKFMREKQLSDAKIMEELEVNNNAYYTLRSRLNQKIEEYLLEQMESPRTSLIKKVATINEIIFTKKKTIAVATLKKLEKELLDYDLANELTIVYKSLKKLLIHSPEDHFHYSQLYNRHVAYMLALDKSEDLLANYFKKYGEYMMGFDETDKMGLILMREELINVSNLYQSHRLFVYSSLLTIFHQLFIEPEKKAILDVEELFDKIQSTFDLYYLDSSYYHLILVLEYLRFEYYISIGEQKKAEKYYEDINESLSSLLTNYNLYTASPDFLLSKLNYHVNNKTQASIYEENKGLFEDFEINKKNINEYLIYILYRSVSCYHADKYEEAAKWLNQFLNDTSIKKYPYIYMETKLVLAYQYCLLKDQDLFGQLVNSIQRQIRLLGKENCLHVILFIKILKVSISENRKEKNSKLSLLVKKFQKSLPNRFSPLAYLNIEEKLG